MKLIEFTRKEKKMLKLISCLRKNKKGPVSDNQLIGVYKHFNRFQKKNRLSKKEIIEYMKSLLRKRNTKFMQAASFGLGVLIGTGISLIGRRIAQQVKQREGEKKPNSPSQNLRFIRNNNNLKIRNHGR